MPEREQPKQEIVKLGQRFQLFESENLIPSFYRNEPRGFSYPVSLELSSGNNPISFDIHLDNISPVLPVWITPFNPDMGYQITNEDFDPKSRYTKLARVDRQTPKLKDGFYLFFVSKGELLKEENPLEELQRLRVHLFFPSGYYESQPAGNVSEKKYLEFSHFYPADTGPLPQLPEEELILGRIRPFKGHLIILPKDFPNDINKLSQVQARFVLADEQPQEK